MNTENTAPDSQQPNPGAGADAAAEAANPPAATGTAPGVAEGQGEGGNTAGSDAGNNGGETAGDKPEGDGQGDTSGDEPLTGAPEAYSDFNLPDGFALDGERKEDALALFRELNLSQPGAQRLVDKFVGLVSADEQARQAAVAQAVEQQRNDWAQQAKTELGDKYDGELAHAKTAVQALNSPKLLEAFNELGWGNHPELIKAFATFGKMMRDSPVEGIGPSGAPAEKPPAWQTMYPDM